MKTTSLTPTLYFLIFMSGIFIFAFFIGSQGYQKIVALAALTLPALALYNSMLADRQSGAIWGIKPKPLQLWAYSFAAVLLGFYLAWLYRQSIGMTAWPAQLGLFGLVAAAIGATEEIIFRGIPFYFLKTRPALIAVSAGALSHAVYKSLLFVSPFAQGHTDAGTVFIYTFIAGLVLGGLRYLSGSVIPPLMAHVLWDILVYADSPQAPWWVW